MLIQILQVIRMEVVEQEAMVIHLGAEHQEQETQSQQQIYFLLLMFILEVIMVEIMVEMKVDMKGEGGVEEQEK